MITRPSGGMAHITRPLETLFAAAVHQVKTMRGVEHLMLELARGALDSVVHDLLAGFVSLDFAKVLGFTKLHHEPAPYLMRQDEVFVDTLWRYCLGLCGNLVVTSMARKTPPLCFALLRSSDPDEVTKCLGELGWGFDGLERLERTGLQGAGCRDFADHCLVGLQQYPREVLPRLAEAKWETVPSDLRDDLVGLTSCWGASLVVEEMFNRARTVSTANRRGSLGSQLLLPWRRDRQLFDAGV